MNGYYFTTDLSVTKAFNKSMHNSVVLHSTTWRGYWGFHFLEVFTWFNICLSSCFRSIARTSKIFYICGKYIIFGANITGKCLFCLRMEILQIRSLYAVINIFALRSNAWQMTMDLQKFQRNQFVKKIRCIYIISEIKILIINSLDKKKTKHTSLTTE